MPSVLILAVAAVAALYLTVARPSPVASVDARRAASRALGVAVVVQAGHFAEEAATGFHLRFPALFGLPPYPFAFFAVFNALWLLIWTASILGLRAGARAAFFPAWFLAIAGAANGVAHPLLAVASRGYFPGLASSPLIGVAAVVLWIRLLRATRSAPGDRAVGGATPPTRPGRSQG